MVQDFVDDLWWNGELRHAAGRSATQVVQTPWLHHPIGFRELAANRFVELRLGLGKSRNLDCPTH
jgi:hypothetical protein